VAPAGAAGNLFAATAGGSVVGIKAVKTGGTSGLMVLAPRRNSGALGG
jgi:hypothetical protein